MRDLLTLAPLIALLFVAFAGAAMAGYAGFRLIPGALRSARWPHVAGRVVQRDKSASLDGTLEDEPRVAFQYIYEIHGVTYAGSRVFFGDDLARFALGYLTARYPTGSPVRVHYHPAHPRVSVLEPGWHGGVTVLLAVGIGLLVFGVAAAMSIAT